MPKSLGAEAIPGLTEIKNRAEGAASLGSMTTELAKSQWQGFFERLAPLLRAQVVEVETTALGLGDSIAADWARLASLDYNAEADMLEIAVHGGDLAIRHPARIELRQEEGALQSIEIADAAGRRGLVVLRAPLRLDFAL